MQVIITGATGFLGRNLAGFLNQNGFAVLGLGRDSARGAELEASGISFVRASLAELPNLQHRFAPGSVIVHCAALASPWGAWSEFKTCNIEGTRSALQFADKIHCTNFVHISTPSIYVSDKDQIEVEENAPLPAPINFYAKSKLAAEKLVESAFQQGLPGLILRPQGIFGAHEPHFLRRVSRVAARGLLPRVDGGNHRIDLTYVDNVCQAILLAINASKAAQHQAYNITNGEPVLIYDTFESIAKRLGYSVRPKDLSFRKAWNIARACESVYSLLPRRWEPPLTRYSVCTLGRTRTLSIKKARAQLGYAPLVPFATGLEKTLLAHLERS